MPVRTWDTQADFDLAYNLNAEPDGHPGGRSSRRLHYHRLVIFNDSRSTSDYVTPEWSKIVAHFAWPRPATTILIVGCGFGWTIEYLNSVGYPDVWGIDTSLYIQGNKAQTDPEDGRSRSEVPTRVHDTDIENGGNRAQLINATVGAGNRFDVIVTERVLTSLTDGEAQTFSTRLNASLLSNTPTSPLIHIDSPPMPGSQQAGYNWHTLAEWKAILPGDVIVESGGGEFV